MPSPSPPSRLAAHCVHRAAGGFPRVVRGARAEEGLVADNTRVATDLFRASGVAKEIGVVLLLPDEDQVRRGHELCDELAARRRTGKGIGRDAVPAGVIRLSRLAPELLLEVEECLFLELDPARLELTLAHGKRLALKLSFRRLR